MAEIVTTVKRVLAVAVIVALPVLLLVPFHPEAGLYEDVLRAVPGWMQPAVWPVVEWGGNVAAFAAFAIAASAFFRPVVVLVTGCAMSATVELLQLVIPNRVASLGDLALNCSGTLIGVLAVAVVRLIARRFSPRTRTAGIRRDPSLPRPRSV